MDKINKPSYGGWALALCAGLGCFAAVAATQPRQFTRNAGGGEQPSSLSWGVNAGVQHSDNIQRSTTAESSDTTGDAGFFLNLNQHRPKLDVSLGSTFAYHKYFNDTYDDDLLGALNGHLGLLFIPEKFTWVVDDNLGQVASNEREADTPDNHQYLNYFSTGPDVTVPLTQRTHMQFSGRWSKADYQDSLTNSKTLSGMLGMVRQLSATKSLSLNISTAHTEYDESQAVPEYDVRSAYLSFDGKGTKTSLQADLGYTELKRPAQDPSGGLLVRVNVDRTLGARSGISWYVSRQFADSADTFRADQSFGGVRTDNQNVSALADPFRADSTGLSWRLTGVRTSLMVNGSWRKETHDQHPELDRRYVEGYLDVQRKLSARLSANVGGTYSKRRFVDLNEPVDQWTVLAGLQWQLRRNLSVALRVDRTTGKEEGSSRDYHENRAMLNVSYTRAR